MNAKLNNSDPIEKFTKMQKIDPFVCGVHQGF
jgi:hypothetical protein